MDKKELFREKISEIHSELPPGANLLIVSKTQSESDIRLYYDLGQRDFGENRVQELQEKAQALQVTCPEIRWHMIGHLQSNKINQLLKIPGLAAIHSVHDRQLVDLLVSSQVRLPRPVDVFLQFNTSKENEKSGFVTYTDLRMAADSLVKCTRLKLVGLMTMGTLRTENFEAEAARCFQELTVEKEKLQSEFNIQLLTSMGMSQDYKIALRERSNWIRLGSMMFN
ncbi:MAG TPA: YggS family pyridoxal phosphate-dependent enzyme [Bacteriovoracaceae bacterium]|nr:YggS family pyridoxal phosphate-dependent enzyme [Bacteriovoracaceae bacterium]